MRADPSTPASARRFIADVLYQRGFSAPGIESAVLLTSEVVTNAVLHAGTDVQLVVVADPCMARVEVHDGEAAVPVPQTQAALVPDAPSGRGLQVVAALAEAWGVRLLPGRGKCVWFEVRA